MTVSHGFELERERRLDELNSTARLYRHARTGAQLLSIINDDENKTFGVSFRTPPADSTGVAHILEHSVLCGSRKYPLKDPFLQLIKGSLKTFLNAMTYPDRTVYPVASQNLQDFYNLVDVYLDAVFHPLITPDVLKQEGWRYELEDPAGPLSYKGVVFNEMKGAYSSPDDRVNRISQQSVYPDNAYGVSSGGDPRDIPDLTYAQFKSFHERYYHPSNARLFFYGDDDPGRRLELLDACLSEFSRIEVDSAVALQPRFSAIRRLTAPLPVGAAARGRQARVTVNWMFDEFTDRTTSLALVILEEILVGTPASPLRKALIDSGLGDGLTAFGLSEHLRQPMFSVGLKGVDAENEAKIETLILETLGRLASEGIDPMTVEAAVNTEEFRLRENNSGSMPRGLLVLLRALNGWSHDRDPLTELAWEEPLKALKARLAGGERVFEELIARHLSNNRHRVTVLFAPDPGLVAREGAEERARLDRALAAMSADERETVIEQARALKLAQETPDSPEALALIPSLALKDLPVKNPAIPSEEGRLADARVFSHDLTTNGVVYLDVGLDLRALSADLLPYVGLFRRALLETGAAGQDFVQLSQRIGRHTGGIRAQTWTSSVMDGGDAAARLFLRAKATPDKATEALAILSDVLLEARLDNWERVEQLIREQKTALEAQLAPMGHVLAGLRLRASLCEADWAEEQIGGLSQLAFLRGLAERAGRDGREDALAALERIRGLLVNRSMMVCNVTASAADLRRFEPELARFLGRLPSAPGIRSAWPEADFPRFEGLTIPAKVNYVAKGANLYRLGFRPGGAALVARQYLASAWLWEKVRVQGGAYGGFCNFDRRSGAFAFGSYRDPNLLQTLAAYDASAGFLRASPLDEAELTRSIIGAIGLIDAYLLPDAKGFVSLGRALTGDSEEGRQRMREEALGCTAADVRAFAEMLDAVAEKGRVVVLGSKDAIDAANAERENWLSVSTVL
jgi:Zn-dependent M16 (insulinase) family peptidase